MKHHDILTMIRPGIFLLLVLGAFSTMLVGCEPQNRISNYDNESESTQQKKKDSQSDTGAATEGEDTATGNEIANVIYQLPKNWEWLDKERLDAILKHRTKNGNGPFVKLEAGPLPIGTTEAAKKKIKASYDERMKACDFGGCKDFRPEFRELKIADRTVYVYMNVGYVWGEPTWSSYFSFEKNGRTPEFVLYDRADLYQDELATVIDTLNWKEIKE